MSFARPAITLLGAAGEVTGSCSLVEAGRSRIVVDCGMIRGSWEDEQRNLTLPKIDWRWVDAVVLTHVHLDHCGRLAMLFRHGFEGHVYCTPATAEILPRLAKSSARLQRTKLAEFHAGVKTELPEDAEEPPVLFSEREAQLLAERLRPIPYGLTEQLTEDVMLRFEPAGHIVGAGVVHLECGTGTESARVVFSGDVGSKHVPPMAAPVSPRAADILVLESTNGGRVRPKDADPDAHLAELAAEAFAKNRRVLFPTFAIGRAQNFLYRFAKLSRANKLHVPVLFDAPTAIFATGVYRRYSEQYRPELARQAQAGDDPLDFDELHYISKRREMKEIKRSREPAFVMAGSGFCDGGPVMEHLRYGLPNPDYTVVLGGFTAPDTLSRALANGEREVSVEGTKIQVEAQIVALEGMSGHADGGTIVDWVHGIQDAPSIIMLNHGEDEARSALGKRLEAVRDWQVLRTAGEERVEL